MRQAVTPISRLFSVPRRDRDLVAVGAGRQHDWRNFTHDVANLAARIEKSGGRRWIVADSDAYALAVGLLAALQAGCQAMLPANLQHGHLADVALTADGAISSSDFLPDMENRIRTFDPAASGDISALRPLDPQNAEIILHTSGTTGTPIAVPKPLHCFESEIAAQTEAFPPRPGRMVLATVPPYHIYGLLFRILWPLSTERPFSTELISHPEELVSAAEKNGGAMFVASPAFLRRALPVLPLVHLKNFLGPIVSSGGPLPPTVAAAYNAVLSEPIREIYGSTETGGIACRSVMDAAAPALWQPLPGVEVAVDSDEQVLAIRSPMLPEKGWFHTDDHVQLHSDGRFELKGRSDRVVNVEEVRVSLPEVERRLADCATVEAARVISLPGGNTERQILAAVIEPSNAGWDVLSNGRTQEMRSLLLDALKPYFVSIVLPRKWRFVTRIPEDDRGKTSNAALAALFEEDPGQSVEPAVVG